MRWTLLLLLTAALFVPERTTAATLATGDIIVTDITLNAVYKVDPNDGTRTILSSGGSLDSPRAVVVSPTGFVFVTESGNTGTHNCGTGANPPCFRGVIRIDPSIAVGEPGNQVIASNSAVFASPRGIVIDSEIGDLLVADANSDTIYRINPASGSASVFSATTGGLESFHFPSDIALEANGDILVTDAPNPKSEPDRRLLRVARTGGTPVVLTKNDLVHGLFATPNGVAVEANGNIVIADSGAAGTATTPPVPASLIRVDRTTLTQSNIPVTGGLQGPRGIAVEQPSGNLLVADVSAKAVYRIDPSSGARTTLTSGSGLGPWGITVVGPLIDPTLLKSNLLVVDKGRQTIVRVTPAGAKLDLASPGALTAPVAVTRTRAGAPWNGALLVADGGAVRAIPPIPGSPMTVSDASFGPYLSNITGIVVDAGNDVLVTDSATDAVIRIKPNGAQSIVGMAGGDLTDPVGLVIDRDGLLVVVSNVTDALTGIHARIVRMNPVTGAHRVIVQDASLHEIRGIALDASGDVLLSDDAPVPQQPTGGVADSVRRLDARFEDLSVVTSAPAGVITSFQGVVADLNRDVIVANIPNPATTPSLPLELLRIDPLRPAIQTSFATAGTAFVELRGIALDAAPPVFELLDSDGDLRGDSVDNCDQVVNVDQADRDFDGIGDACDNDNDIDGIADSVDNCPGKTNPVDPVTHLQPDEDADGVGDLCDSCPKISNPFDVDTNGDMIFDSQKNTDRDFFGDACDPDDDGDGVCDVASPSTSKCKGGPDVCPCAGGPDNCPTTANPFALDKKGRPILGSQKDVDSDGIGDTCDPDDDGDGMLDAADNCPGVSNSGQLDGDVDGAGDACDSCPTISNPLDVDTNGDAVLDAQKDTDKDGLGDACDPDDDADGVCDVAGVSGPKPNNCKKGPDNCRTLSNKNQKDRDLDGIGDTCDNCAKAANAGQEDLDADKVGDVCDLDLDNDTKPNTADNCTRVSNVFQRDSNLDGYGNNCDPDFDNDGDVDLGDQLLLSERLGELGTAFPDFDCDSSGTIDSGDQTVLTNQLGGPPGPSGYTCAGTPPCPPPPAP